MATINLGNIKFNWKGTYAGGTAYVVDDVVSYSGSSYICKLASTGNLPTNGTYWDVMSQAGTAGTDVGTTITTQGDLLYRDGSGLQRLGAGTNGQVLTTGGTGANPSWGTVSSDYVKIAQTTITSSTAEVVFQHGSNNVVIDNTYSTYMLTVGNCYPSSQGENIGFRIGVGGTIRTSGYYQEAHRSYYSGGTDRGATNNYICRFRGGVEDSNHGECNAVLHFNKMTDANFKTSCMAMGVLIDGDNSTSNQVNQGTSGGIYNTAEANDTIHIKMNTGNILKGQFTLYGLK